MNEYIKSETGNVSKEFIAMSQSGMAKAKTLPTELFERERAYRATMSIFRNILCERLITSEEYRKIDTMMAKKYGSLLWDLYR